MTASVGNCGSPGVPPPLTSGCSTRPECVCDEGDNAGPRAWIELWRYRRGSNCLRRSLGRVVRRDGRCGCGVFLDGLLDASVKEVAAVFTSSAVSARSVTRARTRVVFGEVLDVLRSIELSPSELGFSDLVTAPAALLPAATAPSAMSRMAPTTARTTDLRCDRRSDADGCASSVAAAPVGFLVRRRVVVEAVVFREVAAAARRLVSRHTRSLACWRWPPRRPGSR